MNEATLQRTKPKWRWLRIVANGLACLAILGAAAGAIIWINRTEPVAEKINSTRKSFALVETIAVRRGTYSPRLIVLGTVQAAQQISLRPRVNGQVLELSGEFVPGGMVNKGGLLLRIDPVDFENALSISKSELEQAEASMEIEEARQQLAEKELSLLGNSIGDANRSLVMREPQIASMKAEVSAAKANVDRAKLNLERTEIFAPFDAQVLARSVNVGSQVSPGDELGQLIGLEEYWIMAAVPVRSLRWIQFPEIEGQSPQQFGSGSKVILRNQDAWGPDISREAQVARLIGTLDQQTRLARVQIIVKDPLGQFSNVPPLILDTLLETEIECRPIKNIVRLDRDYVRNKDTVWVMKNDKLEIRETEIVFRDSRYAYIKSGLDAGDEVVITTLATVAKDIGLRKTINKDSPERAKEESPGEQPGDTSGKNSESTRTSDKEAT